MPDGELHRHPLFAGVPHDELAGALSIAWRKGDGGSSGPARLRDLPAGKTYMVQGDAYHALSLLLAFRLDATPDDFSGKRLLVETILAPETLAAPLLFTDEPEIPVTLTATDDSRVMEIPRATLFAIADRFPVIYRRLLQDAGSRISFLSAKLRLSSFSTLTQKIAGYLLSLVPAGRSGPVSVNLPYGREDLASLFGVARPSLSRALGSMVREGLISLHGKKIEIRSVAGLAGCAS